MADFRLYFRRTLAMRLGIPFSFCLGGLLLATASNSPSFGQSRRPSQDHRQELKQTGKSGMQRQVPELPDSAGSIDNSRNINILTKKLNATGFVIHQNAINQWKSERRELYLQKARSLPDSIKAYYVAKADSALLYDWPTLKAYDYLQYKREGNRVGYERQLEKRSLSLNYLVMGAIISGNEKYLPQIVNGLWATLEQSTWEIPAITSLQKRGTDLPDPGEQVIGLVGAETAVNIAMTWFMLHDQLEKISPVISIRIKKELEDRILIPYMARTDFWWMGLQGQKVNNWNAWINTNVLITGLFTESAPEVLNPLIKKVFQSTDQFINQYPADGGCDEGPTYWSIASGKLISLLGFISSVSGGTLDWSANSLLHKMGSYIYKMHIDRDYFVNFADATPKVIPNPGSVFEFGQMFQDDTLKAFGGYLFSLNLKRLPEVNLVDFLNSCIRYDNMDATGRQTMAVDHAFLPDLQVFTGRSAAFGKMDSKGSQLNSGDGLFLAVQGGNNGQSHNHNDVGNFILYVDGDPVIVDAGVGTYTALTFSKRRYELWNMQSAWHNLPVVNGVMQHEGAQYKATTVSYRNDERARRFQISMDLAKAYPPAAVLKTWMRYFTLDRKAEKITLKENYELTAVPSTASTEINFLSYCSVSRPGRAGEILFYNNQRKIVLRMKYDPALMDFSVENKVLDDPEMISHWGKQLYRLSFKLKKKALKGSHQFVFQKPPVSKP